jgi:hypothetical protein
MSFIFVCPECKQEISCSDSHLGIEVQCPSCKNIVKIEKQHPKYYIKNSTIAKALCVLAVALALYSVYCLVDIIINLFKSNEVAIWLLRNAFYNSFLPISLSVMCFGISRILLALDTRR